MEDRQHMIVAQKISTLASELETEFPIVSSILYFLSAAVISRKEKSMRLALDGWVDEFGEQLKKCTEDRKDDKADDVLEHIPTSDTIH